MHAFKVTLALGCLIGLVVADSSTTDAGKLIEHFREKIQNQLDSNHRSIYDAVYLIIDGPKEVCAPESSHKDYTVDLADDNSKTSKCFDSELDNSPGFILSIISSVVGDISLFNSNQRQFMENIRKRGVLPDDYKSVIPNLLKLFKETCDKFLDSAKPLYDEIDANVPADHPVRDEEFFGTFTSKRPLCNRFAKHQFSEKTIENAAKMAHNAMIEGDLKRWEFGETWRRFYGGYPSSSDRETWIDILGEIFLAATFEK